MSDTYPYGPLREVGSGLYCMDGTWKKSPLGRRMTVIRSTSGELAIHSAIRLSDADYARILDPLGRVALILVPSRLHGDEAGFYAERYPAARVLVPAPVRVACETKLPRVDGTYDDAWPPAWSRELQPLQVQGTRMGETIFLHAPSRTLVVTDLVFHFTTELTGFARGFMKWNGGLDRVGPTRLFRWMFLTDRESFARSLQPLKAWDFERIVLSHGTNIERDGKRRFLEGYASLGV